MSFSKHILGFLRDLVVESGGGAENRVLIPNSTVTYIRPRARSVTQISPGDLFIFKYHGKFGSGETHLVLVVQNERTATGLFTSTRNNRLLSCFKLGDSSVEVAGIIVENLYKNKQASYSNVISGLSRVLGKSNYRTYDLNKIGDFSEIEYK